jgi:F-type H+-transporting ATPase subunit b
MTDFLMLAASEGGLADIAKSTGEAFGFNWSLFISQALSFIVVAILLQKFAFKPIINVLEERRQKIADSLANAEKIKEQLAQAEEAYAAKLTEAATEASKLIEEARKAASDLRERESQKAVAEAKSIIDKAREANDAELARMKAELRGEVVRLVAETTAKVAGKVLNDDDQKRLADETAQQLAA